ncbi:hypothetical protein OIDMADRAFT_20059 [Oidiodendron maius Zn]|uniref:Uncharacterized protein n=1 Tax=Oidiodendron maius (strain Zn) TaxID=913774 RepID=A0A0C3H7D1_OIDMZ|nr:hypothetical protein OIDMADRAFT_20059 [Oidiodendron maius Zn]
MRASSILSFAVLAVFVCAAPVVKTAIVPREEDTPPMDIVGCYGCTGGRDAIPEPEPALVG